jgi:hypothetical protein
MWAVMNIIFISKVCFFLFRVVPCFEDEKLILEIDIARIAAMGVPYYSFSISWSRVFPFGKGAVNEVALKHYEDVIDTCLHRRQTSRHALSLGSSAFLAE